MSDARKILARIATLVVKEFLSIWKDPKSRFVIIGPPIIQFLVGGYAATFDLDRVRYAYYDEDRSTESRELLAMFEGSPTFHLVGSLTSFQLVDRLVNSQEVRLVIHVPPDFSRMLDSGQTAPLQVITDGRNSSVAGTIVSYARAIVERFNAKLGATYGSAAAGVTPTPIALDRSWFNPNLRSRWFIVSALGGVITTVVVLILSSLSVSRERESGTFDQLLVAPFQAPEILVAKALPPMMLGLADGLIFAFAAVAWFDVPFRGSIPALVTALTVFTVSIVGVGLFISSLSSTMQQSLLGSFIFAMPAILLSGFTTAIESMPAWLQPLTYVNPLRFAVVALREVFLRGGGVREIWPELWPMALIGTATLTAAAVLFRKRTE